MHFKKNGGSLGKDGCLQFIFDHKGVFTLKNQGFDPDELMLEVVDAGAEDFIVEEDTVTIYTEMTDFGSVQKKLQELNLEPTEAGLQRIPNMSKDLSEASITQFLKLIDTLEDDDDVQKVYHNAEIAEDLLEKYL